MMLFCLSNGDVLFYSKNRPGGVIRSRLECGMLSSSGMLCICCIVLIDTIIKFNIKRSSAIDVAIEEWGFIVFNATFNNISVISWRSALFVDETGQNYRPVASH